MEILTRFGLIAMFLALIPPFSIVVPEEVSLLTGGYLARRGGWDLGQTMLVAWLGVVTADCVAWALGRKAGLHPTGLLGRLVGEEQITRIERFYRRYGAWAIVIVRQFPGLRFPAYFFAGASAFPFPRFLRYDLAAGVVTGVLYPWLGYTFHEQIEGILSWIGRFRSVLLGALWVVVGLVIARAVVRWYRARR